MFRWPWTDFHELNLDWIVSKIKEVLKKTAVIVNTVNGSSGDVIIPIISPSTINPKPLGPVPQIGTDPGYSPGDHVHPLPTLSELNAASAWTLLWTNEDPTVDFDTSSVDTPGIEDCDCVMILSQTSITIQRYQFTLATTDAKMFEMFRIHNITISSPYLIVRRFVANASSGKVLFQHAYRKTLNTSSQGVSDNSYQIPIAIYGAKIFKEE